MNDSASSKPEKEGAPRFHVLGPIGDPALFVVLDRTVGTAGADWVQGAAACFPSAWGDPEARAKRVAYALNTMQRLIGDPAQPYYVEEISQAADALAELSTASTLRSMQAMGMGETETALMFGAEGRAATHGSTMLRRLQAELLKFALVGDTIRDQARQWVVSTRPDLISGTLLSAEGTIDLVEEAYRAGMIAGQMAAASGEPRPVGLLPGRDDIAEVLFRQRQSPHVWADSLDADPDSDAGTLVSICRDDADAVLRLIAEEVRS